MGIACKNTHFPGDETDLHGRGKLCGEENFFFGFSKKEAPVLALHWIPAKHPVCIHTCLLPDFVALTVTGWLLLSQAGISTDCSQSYMLLCHVSAKKNANVDIWEIHHVCCWSCRLAKTSTTWLCQKVEVVSVEVEVSLWCEERLHWHTVSCCYLPPPPPPPPPPIKMTPE